MCPTLSMSVVRTHFWAEVARVKSEASSPRKYGLNWTMPAVVSSRVGSSGMREELSTTRCPRPAKNSRNRRLISLLSTSRSL